MRLISSKQFFRILKGEDLEFRILQYPIKLGVKLVFEDLVLPHDINFNQSSFDELVFKNCRFLGDLSFHDSKMNQLSFEGCDFKNLIIKASEISSLEVSRTIHVHSIQILASAINELVIQENPVFESIEMGCENNIMSAVIQNNGDVLRNSFKSTIFICPERFDSIILKDNTSEILHIGTIGEYAHFEVDNFQANLLLFSNCNGLSSIVNFERLMPIDSELASVCIVNSERIVSLNNDGVFSEFRSIKKYKQASSDYTKYRTLAS